MKTLAEILYDAIKADDELMEVTDGRVVSTCFEIPPEMEDNTPLPNIIVTNDGFQNNTSTKDCVWESDEDMVIASVEVAASTDGEVASIVTKVRQAIDSYITTMYEDGGEIPELMPGFPSSDGIEWDWTVPCFYQRFTYQCVMQKYTEDGQEENEQTS